MLKGEVDLAFGHGLVEEPGLVPMVAAGEAFTIRGARFGATRSAFLGEEVLMLPFDDDRVRLVTNAVWRTGRAAHGLAELIPELNRDSRD